MAFSIEMEEKNQSIQNELQQCKNDYNELCDEIETTENILHDAILLLQGYLTRNENCSGSTEETTISPTVHARLLHLDDKTRQFMSCLDLNNLHLQTTPVINYEKARRMTELQGSVDILTQKITTLDLEISEKRTNLHEVEVALTNVQMQTRHDEENAALAAKRSTAMQETMQNIERELQETEDNRKSLDVEMTKKRLILSELQTKVQAELLRLSHYTQRNKMFEDEHKRSKHAQAAQSDIFQAMAEKNVELKEVVCNEKMDQHSESSLDKIQACTSNSKFQEDSFVQCIRELEHALCRVSETLSCAEQEIISIFTFADISVVKDSSNSFPFPFTHITEQIEQ